MAVMFAVAIGSLSAQKKKNSIGNNNAQKSPFFLSDRINLEYNVGTIMLSP